MVQDAGPTQALQGTTMAAVGRAVATKELAGLDKLPRRIAAPLEEVEDLSLGVRQGSGHTGSPLREGARITISGLATRRCSSLYYIQAYIIYKRI